MSRSSYIKQLQLEMKYTFTALVNFLLPSLGFESPNQIAGAVTALPNQHIFGWGLAANVYGQQASGRRTLLRGLACTLIH